MLAGVISIEKQANATVTGLEVVVAPVSLLRATQMFLMRKRKGEGSEYTVPGTTHLMVKCITEAFYRLWASWSLLVGATFVFCALWLLPYTSLLDNEVLSEYNTYRGYIGLIALVLVLITSARIIIAVVMTISYKLSGWFKGKPRRKAIKKKRDTTLRRIQYLEDEQKEMLKSLIEKKQQVFSLPKNSNDYSWLDAYADVVVAEMGIPETEYKFKPWVWKYLKNNMAILNVENADENKQE